MKHQDIHPWALIPMLLFAGAFYLTQDIIVGLIGAIYCAFMVGHLIATKGEWE